MTSAEILPASTTQPARSRSTRHHAGQLEVLFHGLFHARYATRLEGGAPEPEYRVGPPHRIRYTRDYFRSALHEVAHWCVAGTARRRRDDYGYWYAPDGRDRTQQAEFLQVEVLPQAYEALFCAACNHTFRVSLDNLNGDGGDETAFSEAVRRRALNRLRAGLPERPARWVAALWGTFQAEQPALPADLLRRAGSNAGKARLLDSLSRVYTVASHC